MSTHTRLEISMDEQTLVLYCGKDPVRQYPISTGEKGMGFTEESFRTPTGRFTVCEKIGAGEHLHTIFRARVPVGRWDVQNPSEADLILTRIIRMDGLDPENRNTFSRNIYIHGTDREDLLGTPASHGCIRMANADIVELFDRVENGTEIFISPLTKPKGKLLFIDCDSTLSSIEGIDELARLLSPEIFAEVEALTNAAMNGDVNLDEVFNRRMEIIRPNRKMVDQVSLRYLETIVPGAAQMISIAIGQGWLPVILSGGFAPIIKPLAARLGIRHIEAVPLSFNDVGDYAGYGADYPTTRNLGKNEIIQEWKAAMLPCRTIMIGDGISDLETKPDVDLMVGFGGVIGREKVIHGADFWLTNFQDLEVLSSLLKA